MKHIKRIAITNEKGGVGKTMTVVNLSAILSERGYKTLLIDADPQSSASANFDLYHCPSPTLADVLKGTSLCTEAIRSTRFGVDVLPSSADLTEFDLTLASRKKNHDSYVSVFSDHLAPLKDYDFIIIDCPPQNCSLMDTIHYYADAVIIPMLAEDYGIQTLSAKVSTIANIRRWINPRLQMLGGLITMDEKRGLRSDYRSILQEQTIFPIFRSTIRRNITLVRAINAREPICVFDKRSNGNLDYQAFADELLGRIAE